jgi:hypothetical protein
MNMADLLALKSSDRTLEILHPGNGEPIGVRVKIMHIDDDRMARAKRQITDEGLKRQQKGKALKAEEFDHNRHQLVWTAMTGWEWYNPTGEEGDEGYNKEARAAFDSEENPEFNERVVKRVLRSLPWFFDQINEAIGDTEGFFGKSATS